jgi:hypothetical protein
MKRRLLIFPIVTLLVFNLALFLLFLLFACSTSPDVSINGQKKIPQSVAVIFSEELENLRLKFPERGVVDREYYIIGEELTSSLYSNLLSIYENVSLKNEIPSIDEYDIVIKFNLNREKTGWESVLRSYNIDFQDEVSGSRDKSSSMDITTVVEVLDGTNLNILKKEEITGKGIYRQKRLTEIHGIRAAPTIAWLELNRKKFEKAVRDAKLQVNKKVIKFLLKIASD